MIPKHGHKGYVVLRGQVAEDLLEVLDVLLAVVGRQRDSGEQDFDMGVFKGGQHLVEVAARLGDGQAAQAVVAAELDDDDCGVQAQDGVQTGDSILGGRAARSLVEDFVVVAAASSCVAGSRDRIGHGKAMPAVMLSP